MEVVEIKQVTIYQPELPAYRVKFFINLINQGIRDGIEYRIIIFPEKLQEYAGLVNYAKSFTFSRRKSIKIGNRSIFLYKKLAANGVDLIITEYAIRNILTYRLAFSTKRPLLAFWGHGKTYTKKNTRFEEWLKNSLTLRADWFFGYTANGVESVVSNGFPRDRTTIVRNSTDTIEVRNQIQGITKEQISIFCKENDIRKVPTAVFIGELGSSKRIDFLISSAVEISKNLEFFQLVIFGDGPDLHKVLSACSEFSFIKYCGRADIKSQAIISSIGDCIMMPGRVGLIAVDSLVLGLPIVTTNWPWHAPEIEYLTSGRNCIVLGDTLGEYSSGVAALLRNPVMLSELKKNCKKDSGVYSIEDMSGNFHAGVKELLYRQSSFGDEMISS